MEAIESLSVLDRNRHLPWMALALCMWVQPIKVPRTVYISSTLPLETGCMYRTQAQAICIHFGRQTVARLLLPAGHLLVLSAHPARIILSSWTTLAPIYGN